ncbi:unnamed protein product [Rhizoctonia solani]|uniref:Uncharacterized protein n=1 Tax=Rhizoctonia solani TaxID=456999 RepID=A0A8H3CR56_9AGAM|nr:unnamed protein product [Rhizoctonia solani]CAE6495013.1 unnamed protein product [Rhizoctonia solani]
MDTLPPHPPHDPPHDPPPPTLAQLRRLPGASTYRLANKAILKMRKALNLKDAFELSFKNWGSGNEVFDWYTGLPNKNIHTIQLRKERKAPFYHEYIMIRLRNDTYWRIDRRQQEHEPSPIKCIEELGVPAYDTIMQMSGMGSSLGLDPTLGGASDCMVELEFKNAVDLGLVLRICCAIKAHPKAEAYTLQRYNCFFFAQTVIMCTACGASNWGGWREPTRGNNGQEGPWKSPNAPLDKIWSDLNNVNRPDNSSWKSTEKFNHKWDTLFQQSNALVQASPLLRHADRCNYCLESQSVHRQRSMSREINRLKDELLEYWNKEYRELLDEAYWTNHIKFIESGIWRIVAPNTSEEDCRNMLEKKLVDIQTKWDHYSEERLVKLLASVRDLLDPAEVCDSWYPDPDEWKSTWTCKDGGPVKAAMDKWERDVQSFIQKEFSKIKGVLETQTIQRSTQIHTAAMQTRVESFEQAMTIRLRGLDENKFLEPTETAEENAEPSGSVMSLERRSVFSGKTFGTVFSKMTTRATKIKHKVRRLFKGPNNLDEVQIALLERRIRVFITKHGDNVQTYRTWLKCTSVGVQGDMKQAMDDVWHQVTGLPHLIAKDGTTAEKLAFVD